MIALYIFLGIFGILFIYLFAIIFLPVLKVEMQPIKREEKEIKAPSFREDVEFDVEGMKVKGWLYLPDNKEGVPCIVMCHGLCGTKDFALEDFAVEFVRNGFAVLTFDYRYFGDSEGLPRQNYCGPWQVQDAEAGIEFVRNRKEINKNKIFVWGTSGGAPYPLIIASKDHTIAGVIAQAGSFNHKEDNKYYMEKVGLGHFLKLFMHAQRDKGRSRFGLSAHIYPPYGRPGTLSFLNLPGTFDGIERIAKYSKTFRNEIPGRIAINPHPEDVLVAVETVKCNALIVIAIKDEIIAPNSHHKLMELLGDKGKLVELDAGHFDIYQGETFQKNIKVQLEFLLKEISE